MKKSIVIAVILLGALWYLSGSQLIKDPLRTLEDFAIRHAASLPLGAIGEIIFDSNCASCPHPVTERVY